MAPPRLTSVPPILVTEGALDDWWNTPIAPVPIIASASREWTTPADYAAEMTNRQFAALGVRLNHAQLRKELATQIQQGKPPKPAKNYEADEVRKWATLTNGPLCLFLLNEGT